MVHCYFSRTLMHKSRPSKINSSNYYKIIIVIYLFSGFYMPRLTLQYNIIVLCQHYWHWNTMNNDEHYTRGSSVVYLLYPADISINDRQYGLISKMSQGIKIRNAPLRILFRCQTEILFVNGNTAYKYLPTFK